MDGESPRRKPPSFLLPPFLPSSLTSLVQSTFPWPDYSSPHPFFVDQCAPLSPPARFPAPHKQDLVLIDAPCSIKVTPPHTTNLLCSTFLLLLLPPASLAAPPFLSSVFAVPCPALPAFNRSSRFTSRKSRSCYLTRRLWVQQHPSGLNRTAAASLYRGETLKLFCVDVPQLPRSACLLLKDASINWDPHSSRIRPRLHIHPSS